MWWLTFLGSFLLFLVFVPRTLLHQVWWRAVLFAVVMGVWSSAFSVQEGAVANCECLKLKMCPLSAMPATE